MYHHIKKKNQIKYFYARFLLFRAVLYSLSFFSWFGKVINLILFYPFILIFRLLKLPFTFFNSVSKKQKSVLSSVRYFVIGVLFGSTGMVMIQTYGMVYSLPNPNQIGRQNYPVSTKIFDRNGKLLYEIYREQNRTPITLKEIPIYVAQATIAIEDKDFYHHNGISLFGGIVRAIKDNILTNAFQGGSTITQQLVKTALLTPEKTLLRKIKEIILALWAERLFSKQQILEMYLNQVPYGGLSYGIEEAAQTYFGKYAKVLTLSESAFIAGLPQAPSIYSPYNDPVRAKQRRDEVLRKMREQKYISENQYVNAVVSPLIITLPKTPIKAPHFVFYVKSLLENEYGIRRVEEGGLRVYTSLDINIQKKAENILQGELKKIQELHVSNGALLVTVPSTGEIITMVGGRDYFEFPSGTYNVTMASRQPGSMIKPLMYSLALAKRYTTATILEDTPISFPQIGRKSYTPVNYDNRFHGKIPLRLALANSYNVPAVKVLNTIGVQSFIDHAKSMGITTWTQRERYGLALTLGGAEVKMTDIAVAFSAFANKGKKVEINPFIKIADYKGEILYERREVKSDQVISPAIAFIISDILSDSVARRAAFGSYSGLEIPGYQVAVKTGTTNDKRDNWTIGYTSDILVATWVGNNDNSPMNQYVTSGITGAAPIWNKMMRYILESGLDAQLSQTKTIHFFAPPDDVVQKICYFNRIEYFIKGTENTVNCRAYMITPSPKSTQ